MCLATVISRSRESADFSNVIPVVEVGDMSVSVARYSLTLLLLYEVPRWPRCCNVLPLEQWVEVRADYVYIGGFDVPHLNFG